MSHSELVPPRSRNKLQAKAIRPGRSALVAGALGLVLSTALASPAWAGTIMAPGQDKDRGQPCAGCVGNADTKSPPGQELEGLDPNAGYECDTNRGVGQGNPAHTGCVSA